MNAVCSMRRYPPAHFVVSSPSFPCPGVLWVGPQGQTLCFAGEVRAHWTQNHIQQGVGSLLYTQRLLQWTRKHTAMKIQCHLIKKNITACLRTCVATRRCPPYLSAEERGSDVQTGRFRVRNPVLLDLYQSPDALQKL